MFVSLFLLINVFCNDPVLPPTNAKAAEAELREVATLEQDFDSEIIDTILKQWEAASKRKEKLSRSQRENLRMSVSASLNGHAAIAIEKLADQIDPAQLKSQFHWTQITTDDIQIGMEAVPRDETEQLFYQSIRIKLNPKTWQMSECVATDRHGQACATWKNTALSIDVQQAVASDLQTIDTGRVVLASAHVTESTSQKKPVELANLQVDDPKSPWTVTECLEKMEAASSKAKTSRLRVFRTVYNLVFEEEKRFEGELIFDGVENVKLSMRPEKVRKGEKSARTDKKGNAFSIVEGQAETWIWTATEIQWVNDETRTVALVQPPRERTPSTNQSWFPFVFPVIPDPAVSFLFGIHADQLQRDWSMRIRRSTETIVIISATPKSMVLQRTIGECLLMIDTESWQITAVKSFDPSGKLETVYKVNDRKINVELPDDCFHPDWKSLGYKLQ